MFKMISFDKACRKVLSFCDMDSPTIEQAFEYKQWYVFNILPEDYDGEPITETMYAVDRRSGKVSTFSPFSILADFNANARPVEF